jgi:hypothetical protein
MHRISLVKPTSAGEGGNLGTRGKMDTLSEKRFVRRAKRDFELTGNERNGRTQTLRYYYTPGVVLTRTVAGETRVSG